MQATEVVEAMPRFRSPYVGANSLRGGDVGLSQTYTLYFGIRVVDDLDVYLEPEAATGRAPGQGTGLAGYGMGTYSASLGGSTSTSPARSSAGGPRSGRSGSLRYGWVGHAT